MTDKRHTYMFEKGSHLIKSLVEALEKFEVGGKFPFLDYNKIFYFFEKYNSMKNSCHSNLYLLDVFGFGLKFGPYINKK